MMIFFSILIIQAFFGFNDLPAEAGRLYGA